MRAIDVAEKLIAGPMVARMGTATYGIESVEPKRGGLYLYVHLSSDGNRSYPGGGSGTRFFLPGKQGVEVGSVEVIGGVQVVHLGPAAVKSHCNVKLTVAEAKLVRDALATMQGDPATPSKQGDASKKLAEKIPAGEIKQ